MIISLEFQGSETNKENKRVLSYFQHNPNNTNLFPSIRNTFDNLQQETTPNDVFQKYELKACKCQSANLLSSSKLSLCNERFTVSKFGEKCR